MAWDELETRINPYFLFEKEFGKDQLSWNEYVPYGVSFSIGPTPEGVAGYYDPTTNHIQISIQLSGEDFYKTLKHERGHACQSITWYVPKIRIEQENEALTGIYGPLNPALEGYHGRN